MGAKKIIGGMLLAIPMVCFADKNLDSSYGAIEFEKSCSSCHGFDGKGRGYKTEDLKTPASDLTVLSKNNSGHFPFTEIYRVIDGSAKVGFHSTREMPVWGEEYREEAREYGLDEAIYARGVMLELMLHIYSIQEE